MTGMARFVGAGMLAWLMGLAPIVFSVAVAEAPAKPPRWFAYRCPYGVFEAETIKRFAAAGVNVIHISPLNTLSSLGLPYSPYPPSWIGPGMYDFAPVDRYIADVLAANPRARILCAIDLNTPVWWPRSLWSVRRIDSFCELGRVAASDEWRKETRDYLQAFLKHTESRHAASIVGYTLFCGMTLEWQDQSFGQESPSKRAAWRTWSIGRSLPDPLDIPVASVREHVSHGFFRDPVRDGLAIEYWRFSNWLIGDTILYFAGAAQEVVQHRVPLGVFYGYLWEHAVPGRMPFEGHLDFDRVYRSGLLDFITAPGTYHDRGIGGASGYMMCLGSLAACGKGFVQEIDHRTPSARSVTLLGKPIPGHESGFSDDDAAIAGLRREFAMALVHRTSLWWCNLFGHWYDSPRIMAAIAQMQSLWDQHAGHNDQTAAEVVVLADAESMYYVDGRSPQIAQFLFRQRFGLGRMGAPYDVYSFADVPELDLARYKLVLLPNLFVIDGVRRQWLREKVCTGGKTVVWVYAPGIITDGKYDPAHVKALIGIPWGTKTLSTRVMDGWTSVFAPEPNLSAGVLRELARKAGVHIYSEFDEPLYASARYVALHTASGGKRTLRLPSAYRRVRELFSGRIVAENASRVEDELPAPATVLYALETP
jgi:hypothetical protein